jgi:long-chain fatty acid transport protein
MKRVATLRLLASGAVIAGLAMGAAPAMAGGFYLQDQSTKASGRAFSGEVADQGAESIWWNPAAIGGLQGGSAAISVTAILPRADVTNTGTLIVRPGQAPAAVGGDQTTSNPINNGVVPSGSIAHSVGHGVAVGLAITAPFNFTTQYPATSWARYSALTTRLRTIDIQPTIAVELTPGLSVGAAVNVERASATLGNALPNLSPLLPDGSQTLTGSGWDVGYSVGAQYRQGPLSLGVSYKSAISHTLNGQLNISGLLGPLAAQNTTLNTNAKFTTPWQLSMGARYKVTNAVTLNASATRFGWAKFDAIRLGAPVNAALPENYRNTWSYAVGTDVDINPKWTVRAGVQRDLTPVRGEQRDARVPDSNRWNFAMGATHSVTQKFKVDAAFNYLTLDNGGVNRITAAYAGTAAQTPVLTNGVVTSPHVFILSLGGRLSF